MKRIYMAFALVAGLASGAAAQRSANLAVFYTSPIEYTFNCTDSVEVNYGFINEGPDVISATDTMRFYDGLVDSGYVYRITGTAYAVGDTVFAQIGKVAASEIARLADPDNNYAWVYSSSFTNKTYLYPVWFYGYGWSVESADVVDPNDTNNIALSEFTLNCSSLGVKDASVTKTNLSIYPNPAADVLNFDFTSAAVAPATLRILDITGRLVKSEDLGKTTIGTKKYSLNVENIPTGTYIVEFNADGQKAISKFTKL
ncbi:MAG: T9SS type A sorting domain-containing protein [Edaphocola sp.]